MALWYFNSYDPIACLSLSLSIAEMFNYLAGGYLGGCTRNIRAIFIPAVANERFILLINRIIIGVAKGPCYVTSGNSSTSVPFLPGS